MFETALVESAGKLKSKSRYWMFATLAFNLLILTALILIPLLHPEALPRTALTATLIAPPPPPAAPPPAPVQAVRAAKTIAPLNPMVAPPKIPTRISTDREPPPPTFATSGIVGSTTGGGSGSDGGVMSALNTASVPVAVTPVTPKPKPARIPISAGVAAGALLNKTTPAYPAIAKAAHVSGSVVLRAIISKAGTSEGLQVVSGPEMLRASALDAVRQWRYHPYLLNGEPTEVETTVTVNFTFGG
ncbi:energy transducer TonB [Terriglobus aquaticus]|uniref:Energy transducer TonB n=1 Tax=Terriglobus aquaticus TaxID=940139 RepID=A0ABW9KNV9_9BACT|nr:energy transducer TonB [Terriglobus aquaticus]